MSEILNSELQLVLMNGVIHAAEMAYTTMAQDAGLPHVLMRPELSLDGNKWCAMYGANLHSGVGGFGDSPHEAMRAFDGAWYAKVSP